MEAFQSVREAGDDGLFAGSPRLVFGAKVVKKAVEVARILAGGEYLAGA